MKKLLVTAAALSLLVSAPAFAADNSSTTEPNPSAAGKNTNSDGTSGATEGDASGMAGKASPTGPNKNTNSDGTLGDAELAPGTSINDGAGSTADQKPASDTGEKKY